MQSLQPFQPLVGFLGPMTHVLDFIGDADLFRLFSAKQLAFFWQHLSVSRQRDIFHMMFFQCIDFDTSGRQRDMMETVSQFITFFYFFNVNWKHLMGPYITKLKNGMFRFMSLPLPFVPYSHTFNPMLFQSRKIMKDYMCRVVQDFLMSLIRRRVQNFRNLSADDRVLLLSLVHSIRPMIGSRFDVLCNPLVHESRHVLYPLLVAVNADLTSLVETPGFDRSRFRYIVELLKSFGDYGVTIYSHPINYYRQVNHQNFPDVFSFLENSSLRDKGAFVAKVCGLTKKLRVTIKYSRLLWNHGCRCANHVDIIQQEIVRRELRKPYNVSMTGEQMFAHSKKVAVLCREVTDTAVTPVDSAIYRELFMAGCRCTNHTSLVL